MVSRACLELAVPYQPTPQAPTTPGFKISREYGLAGSPPNGSDVVLIPGGTPFSSRSQQSPIVTSS